jgi:aspartate/methionine/tyrosine aminotransferase
VAKSFVLWLIRRSFIYNTVMKRFEHISPFIVMDILDKARRMEDVIHLEVGEPDLDAPPAVIEAFTKAVKDGKYKYTSALGLMELREAIADYYHRRYGVDVSPGRIAITPGTSGAFLVSYAMLLESGQKIALSDPSYPCYKNFSYILDTEPVFIPVNDEAGFCITAGQLEKHTDITAVQISSPSNPVGNIYDSTRLSELIDYSQKNGIAYISDEIYHGLINGFSKYFCMPGFRIGWMILPEGLMRKAEMAIQNVFIAANTPAQYAALNAFDEKHLATVRDEFRKRRDYLYESLSDMFAIPQKPLGAFYIWADIGKYGLKGTEFADRLLNESRVAITPGIDFGSNETDRFVRLAFTRPVSELKEGIKRINTFLTGLQG